MWVYDSDYGKWGLKREGLLKRDFDYLKQELSSTRFYSSFLSGATYVPVSDVDDIYDMLGKWKPRSWYVSSSGSVYTSGAAPIKNPVPIDQSSSYDFYTRFISEYGLTLKNLFTIQRIMADSVRNFIEVDLATTASLSISGDYPSLSIDGVAVKKGSRILVKDQIVYESIDTSVDPSEYFAGNYYSAGRMGSYDNYFYYGPENGIYTYDGSRLVRDGDFDDYSRCLRHSVSVRNGSVNAGKQFHLSRLNSGYFPTTSRQEPVEFKEKKNYLIRHKVDYNNLFEANYYDVIKHGSDSYAYGGVTYSIPERTISIGEFGLIICTQDGMSTIIPNEYKVALRSLSMTNTHYWICGDDSLLLKVSRHDFEIKRIKMESVIGLKSISFHDDVRGVVVGEQNTILITLDGGNSWKRLRVDDFASFTYNKVVFAKHGMIYIGGRNGIFIEIEESPSGWTAYRRRVSRHIDDDDEVLLMDNINDMVYAKISNWGLSYGQLQGQVGVDKEILFIATDNSGLIAYDINSSTVFDFLYLGIPESMGDIKNVSRRGQTNDIHITCNSGLYRISLGDMSVIGLDSPSSNYVHSSAAPMLVSGEYANEIYDYNGAEIVAVGNSGMLKRSSYPISALVDMDPFFSGRLKSKMLFLDYDMASKLSFFTDQGDYRLPNPVSFATDSIGGITIPYSSNNSIARGANTLISDTITVVSGQPMQIKEVRLKVDINITDESSLSIALRKRGSGGAPSKTISVLRTGQARRSGGTGYRPFRMTFTNRKGARRISEASTYSSWELVRMDMQSPTFNINPQTVINENSIDSMVSSGGLDYMDGTWEILVYATSNSVQQVNLITWSIEFVQEKSSLSLLPGQHWWSYRSDREKTFPYWSNEMSDSNAVVMRSVFTSESSYTTNFPYSLQVSSDDFVLDDSMISPLLPGGGSTYMRGTSPGIQLSVSNSGQPKHNTGKPTIYAKGKVLVLEVDSAWPASVGDVIKLDSDEVSSSMVVNRILSVADIKNAARTRKFIYAYSGYDDAIIAALSKSDSIRMRNLNRYIDIEGLCANFAEHPIGLGYSMTFSSSDYLLTISPMFNPDTAYYNMAGVFSYYGTEATMSYEDSFLKFGYTPTYNILDYLEEINVSQVNPTFHPDKEYLALPSYEGIPLSEGSFGVGAEAATIYIDNFGMTGSNVEAVARQGNFLVFGPGLVLEWRSLFINTFVDVEIIDQDNDVHTSQRLLVTNKYSVENYLSSGVTAYIVEFHEKIKYKILDLEKGTVSIRSRRKLSQISADLMEINNIHRPKNVSESAASATYSNYVSSVGYKFPTDSYAKALLSDSETVSAISALFYTDYKNEIAMNVTKLDRKYETRISNTSDNNGYLMITSKDKHGLSVGDGVVLDFDGGQFSSQVLNHPYFGYRGVKAVVSDYEVVLDIAYGNRVHIGNDSGTMRYIKKDPFFNYQPVDIFEIGADKMARTAIKLTQENVSLSGSKFYLDNVDWKRYRYRMMGGMTLQSLNDRYPWFLDAEVTDAVIGEDSEGLVWYKGIWESGRWFGGTWNSGIWRHGDWYGGKWYSRNVVDKGLSVSADKNSSGLDYSVWSDGRWYDGQWGGGTWVSGRWYGGTWDGGVWNNGIWNDGIWNKGRFIGGIWVMGVWNAGTFNTDNEPSFWIDGTWKSGDFENGIWYGGVFGEEKGVSRFGIGAYNSRTAIWYGGKWKSGGFYSGESLEGDVSDVHKYSIWYSGKWSAGEWHGGIAYGMDFAGGTWHGGILEDIQVIGMNSANNSLILNGIFRFSPGDRIMVIDSGASNEYSRYGAKSNPREYMVLKNEISESERITEVYVAADIDTSGLVSYRKSSGELNYQIPNRVSHMSHTISVPFDSIGTNELKVSLDIRNKNLGDLAINLSSPNGMVINIKPYGPGGTVSGSADGLYNAVFTTDDAAPSMDSSTTPYSGEYRMYKTIGIDVGGYVSNSSDVATMLNDGVGIKGDWSIHIQDKNRGIQNLLARAEYANIGDRIKIVIDIDRYDWIRIGDMVDFKKSGVMTPILSEVLDVSRSGTQTILTISATAPSIIAFDPPSQQGGIWSASGPLMVESNPRNGNSLVGWEIQFDNGKEVGAQIGYTRENGIETGLRVVGVFKNSRWKSGIWTNGVFEGGVFEGGVWYDGVFEGKWG
jgi:subtilisin-like proprotein convertase family protein